MDLPRFTNFLRPALPLLLVAVVIPTAVAQDATSPEALLQIIKQQQALLQKQQAQIDLQSKQLGKLQQEVQSLVTKTDTHKEIIEKHDTVVKAATTANPPTEGANIILKPDAPTSRPITGLSAESRHPETGPPDLDYSSAAIVLRDPKTGTEVGIHGFAQFQAFRDSDGMDNNEFDTFMIPVGGAPAQTKYSVNPSRIGIDSKTPLGWGRVNTLVSMDLNGKLGEPDWRLREAYGEFINDDRDYSFLVGQTYSTALDLHSVPESLDFAGPTGYYARRQPLVRYSKLFDHKVRLDIGADTPENASYLDADTRTKWPDLTVAGTWLADRDLISHLRLQGTVRDLRATDTVSGMAGNTTGWHLGFTGKIKTPFLGERDNFRFGVLYGDGYGGQLKSGPFDAAFNPMTLDLEKVGVISSYGGYQHWWCENLRSNFIFGLVDADNPAFMAGDRLESTYYLSGNIVWNPLKNITLGLEYLHGYRENVDGASGDANRLLFSTKFDF